MLDNHKEEIKRILKNFEDSQFSLIDEACDKLYKISVEYHRFSDTFLDDPEFQGIRRLILFLRYLNYTADKEIKKIFSELGIEQT